MRLLGALESDQKGKVMPQTNIIASGNTAQQSSWYTLAPSDVHTLLLRGNGTVLIEARDADNGPEAIGDLTPSRVNGKTTQVLGPITYRVNRPAQANNVAVDQIT
jgi:hypothetical protein